MRWIEVNEYGEKQFHRLTGVKRAVFEQMVEVVSGAQRDFGRPRKLSVADQVLLTLCYWREYRSQFHVASSFAVSEATVCRTVHKVEAALLEDKRFHLPGKKVLHQGSLDLTVVVVDATEQRIERPQESQKNSAASTQARRSAIPRRGNS
jgi:hypothetical protein